jgi:DNA-binding NarL/FixJ family response regulator
MSARANRETIEEYLARGGKVTACERSDLAPRRPIEEAQIRRAPSIHPENRKVLKRQVPKSGTSVQQQKALVMLQAGTVQREVAQKCGISQRTVKRIAAKAGLSRKKLEELVQ